jgi:hypothetical protein
MRRKAAPASLERSPSEAPRERFQAVQAVRRALAREPAARVAEVAGRAARAQESLTELAHRAETIMLVVQFPAGATPRLKFAGIARRKRAMAP